MASLGPERLLGVPSVALSPLDGGYGLTPTGREIVTIVSEVPVGSAPEAARRS